MVIVMSEMDQVAELRELGSCVVSDALDAIGFEGATGVIRPMVSSSPSLAGTVVTVLLEVRRADDPVGPHLATAAIDSAKPGEVIVIANAGRTRMSSWGGMLTEAAMGRGVAGVVIDGACRDVEEAEAKGFPVFARGATPVSAKGRTREVATNVPITIDRVRVHPGDFVVADANGVAFVPAERIGAVLEAARRILTAEHAALEAMGQGSGAMTAIDDRALLEGAGDGEP